MECPSCQNNDPEEFVYDLGADGSTCKLCGAVLPGMCLADLEAMQSSHRINPGELDLDMDELQALDSILGVINDVAPGGHSTESTKRKTTRQPKPFGSKKPPKIVKQSKPAPKKDFKGSYARRAYNNELIRAALCLEPVIPDVDLDIIKEYYRKVYSQRDVFQRERAAKKYIKRTDIQVMLRSLDRKHTTKRFTQQYLEKWKSIKRHLGGKVKIFTPQETAAIGAQLSILSAKWDLHQPAAHKNERSAWTFEDRKDMPNFNTLVVRIMDKLGIKGYRGDFHLPVTANAQRNLAKYIDFLDPDTNKPVFKQSTLLSFLTR